MPDQSNLRSRWPLIFALLFLYGILALIALHTMEQNDGHFIYPLDDPYIHMAMAKNFAQHHTWGVTSQEFTSSSSSPLWTLLLSLLFLLFGVDDAIPLALNVVFGSFLVIAAFSVLRKFTQNSLLLVLSLMVTMLSIPLPMLILSGQEHTLHVLLAGIFAYLAGSILAQEDSSRQEALSLWVVTPLLVMTRYEGLFMVFAACLLFLLRKEFRKALILGFLGLLPVVIYGIACVAKGWYFLPNSVILKGNIPQLSSFALFLRFAFKGFVQMVRNQEILLLLIATMALWWYARSRDNPEMKRLRYLTAIFLLSAILHLQFAIAGWFYRYEAYLVGLGLWILSLFLFQLCNKADPEHQSSGASLTIAVPALIAFLFLSPFLVRAYNALISTVVATTNIYEQHFQVAMFLNKYYQGQSIAANDIGAINYYADIKCLDLWGLANKEVGRARLKRYYSSEVMDRLSRENTVKIAVIYEHWFDGYGGVPKQWVKVGEWKILHNTVAGSDVVAFYVVDPSEVPRLIQSLGAFSHELPPTVLRSIATIK